MTSYKRVARRAGKFPAAGLKSAREAVTREVAEAKRRGHAMSLPYDPRLDQCGPGQHGPERAGVMWYGDPVFMCPRCYANVLGAPPLADSMVDARTLPTPSRA